MKITLARETATEHSTPGQFFINDVKECFTLEPPPVVDQSNPGPVCIPAGTYQIRLQYSPAFKRIMPYLQDVPNRDRIMIHWGNWVYDAKKHIFDTEGCIEVGTFRVTDDQIGATQNAFAHLYPKLQVADEVREDIWITIIDPQPPADPSSAA